MDEEIGIMIAATLSHAARYYNMGLSFLSRAREMVLQDEEPQPLLLFSIVVRSIENLCMFLCINRGFVPCRETMEDFVIALDACGLMNEEIRSGMLDIEKNCQACNPIEGRSLTPGKEMIMNSIYTAERILIIAEVEKRVSA